MSGSLLRLESRLCVITRHTHTHQNIQTHSLTDSILDIIINSSTQLNSQFVFRPALRCWRFLCVATLTEVDFVIKLGYFMSKNFISTVENFHRIEPSCRHMEEGCQQASSCLLLWMNAGQRHRQRPRRRRPNRKEKNN